MCVCVCVCVCVGVGVGVGVWVGACVGVGVYVILNQSTRKNHMCKFDACQKSSGDCINIYSR